MSARWMITVTPLAGLISLCLVCLSPLHAQLDSAPTPEIENARFQFTGVVNANAVYVRSGPSENDYPTMKLDKGAEVVVLGMKFEWLKIQPPEGSFCYVAKLYVERRGNGSIGRVTSTLNVRIGSQLNELKAKIGTKLEPGTDVEIVGEEQEYFKIKPPEGVYFYVNKQFVDPVRPVKLAQDEPQAQPLAEAPTADELPPSRSPRAFEQPDEQSAAAEDLPVTTTPPLDSRPPQASGSSQSVARGNEPTPATQPSVDAEAEFDRLEQEYAEASLKPLDEQPITELLEEYQKMASSDALPESLRRIADFKAEVLKNRLDVQQEFSAARKHLDEMKQRQMALKAEREELEQRIKENELRFYTAVGTLRPSSLQQGAETLYRLTDPANGRTVVYLRTNDEKIGGLIGQFIGIKGEVQNDPQLNVRVISPSSYEPVNPTKVGQTVAAQIVPASLLPGMGTARTE